MPRTRRSIKEGTEKFASMTKSQINEAEGQTSESASVKNGDREKPIKKATLKRKSHETEVMEKKRKSKGEDQRQSASSDTEFVQSMRQVNVNFDEEGQDFTMEVEDKTSFARSEDYDDNEVSFKSSGQTHMSSNSSDEESSENEVESDTEEFPSC